MLLIKIFSLFVLTMIFIQDIKDRAVYWIWFPLLAGSLILIRLKHTDYPERWWEMIVLNLALIGIQLLLLMAYFSFRFRRWTNITQDLLGWGDLLFLLSMSVYFSPANYMFYYVVSLAFVLIAWSTLKLFKKAKTNKIPLAGFQSLVLILFLTAEWWLHLFDLGDDERLLMLLHR